MVSIIKRLFKKKIQNSHTTEEIILKCYWCEQNLNNGMKYGKTLSGKYVHISCHDTAMDSDC